MPVLYSKTPLVRCTPPYFHPCMVSSWTCLCICPCMPLGNCLLHPYHPTENTKHCMWRLFVLHTIVPPPPPSMFSDWLIFFSLLDQMSWKIKLLLRCSYICNNWQCLINWVVFTIKFVVVVHILYWFSVLLSVLAKTGHVSFYGIFVQERWCVPSILRWWRTTRKSFIQVLF